MVVICAHVPPPMHGQSYMVQLLLDGLRARGDLRVVHIDARFSVSASDIGSAGARKVWLALRYACRAIAARFRHGAQTLYYVPAPGKRAAVYRDWIVIGLCRPFFARLVLHWHAVGLGEWTRERASGPERFLTQRLLGAADLSIVLSEFARSDATLLRPRQVAVIANGIPDPCPDFPGSLRAARAQRIATRTACLAGRSGNEEARFTALFLASCSAEKGLFAAVDGLAALSMDLGKQASGLRLHLLVAGEFASTADRARFEQRLCDAAVAPLVEYVGFADSLAKRRLFEAADCLCFPSIYPHEGQPVAIIEALAYDLPIVATRWRGIPEMLSGTASVLIETQDPAAVARGLAEAMALDPAGQNRRRFLERFEQRAFAGAIGDAIGSLV